MTAIQHSICKACPHLKASVFSDLESGNLDQFCKLKLVNHYKRQQRIFYEGEPNLGLFIVCSGKVKLSRSSTLGRRRIVEIVGPCGLLQERDLFLESRRTVTAEAIEDSVVCFVKKEDLFEFVRMNPQVAWRLVERLSRELEWAHEKIESLTAMDAKRRLADLLLQLAGRHGRPVPGGRLIDLKLTREEMAEMLGTTPETVIRVLSAFRKAQWIGEVGKQVVIISEERLKRLAGRI